VLSRLDVIVERAIPILLGDAPGVDAAVQHYLADRKASRVTIYCGSSGPRHNVGGWPVVAIRSEASHGTRAWHSAKDQEMSRLARTGFVIWDGSSAGSLANIRRLCDRGCYVLVYLNAERRLLPLRFDSERAAFLASHASR
jgi:hypothetical protein